ncbi:MAG: DnaD domain protein [Streptococcaceae bacterium]|jgi:replication initiation and membrane attachment protein|nr:DnaD domain protein [Streptococcaceae bacterium]
MRPIDQFIVENVECTSFDAGAFSLYYQPIISLDGFALYQLLRVFPHQKGRLSDLLNHLDYGLTDLANGFDKLSALKLVNIYDDHGILTIVLNSPLTPELFLADGLYRQLLIDRIGQPAVARLQGQTTFSGKEISKKFSDVYRVTPLAEEQLTPVVSNSGLDLSTFKTAMQQQGLQFLDETKDTIALYALADKFGLDWYQLFKVAEETQNADHSLNTANLSRRLITQNQKQPRLTDFSKTEQAIIRTAKAEQPENLLAQIKKRRFDGHPTQKEKQVLVRLARDGVSSEIQNMLIIYFLDIRGYSNISDFIEEQANRWKKEAVTSAELAVKWLASYQTKQADKRAKKAKPPQKTAPVGSKTPDWYDPNYQNETSADQQAELERIKRQALGKMTGGD